MSLTAEQKESIAQARAARNETRRVVAPGLEAALYEPTPVLDHGFVRVIDYMGDDGAIVQAARVSYGTGTRAVQEDQGLINYLMRHRHTTPFEMCEIKFHVKLPIFVARQWIRHRTANVNEYSARYSILDKEFYIPAPDALAAQSSSNKQGRGDVLEGDEAAFVLETLKADANRCYADYEHMLNRDEAGEPVDPERQGLARELARMNLPLNAYTQWYWKIDLHNLLHFLNLRSHPHAQYEIRVYAQAMLDLVKTWVPLAHAAFVEYVQGGAHFSASQLAALKRMLDGEAVDQPTSGMSRREWREMREALGFDDGEHA